MMPFSEIVNTDFNKLSEALIWQSPGLMVCKDKDLRYLAGNKNYTQAIGYSSLDEIIGITDYDIRCEAVNSVNKFKLQDQRVLAGEELTVFDMHLYCSDRLLILLTKKTALKNADDQIIGVIFHAIEITSSLLKKQFFSFIKNDFCLIEKEKSALSYSYILGHHAVNYKLSMREEDCLYHIIRGKSAGMIAEQLNLSRRTVEAYIENLKRKLGCQTKSELIEKAIDEGFAYFVPKNLISLS